MPLPWLIGAAVVLVATAVAASSSDDESSSNSSSSGDAERARKEAEEKERKLRLEAELERKKSEIAQKKEAALDDFKKEGKNLGHIGAKFLPSELLSIDSDQEFELHFDLQSGKLKYDMEEALSRDLHLFFAIESLREILPENKSQQEIIKSLVIFSEIYRPSFRNGIDLKYKEKRIQEIDVDINTLEKIKIQLVQLKNTR